MVPMQSDCKIQGSSDAKSDQDVEFQATYTGKATERTSNGKAMTYETWLALVKLPSSNELYRCWDQCNDHIWARHLANKGFRTSNTYPYV